MMARIRLRKPSRAILGRDGNTDAAGYVLTSVLLLKLLRHKCFTTYLPTSKTDRRIVVRTLHMTYAR